MKKTQMPSAQDADLQREMAAMIDLVSFARRQANNLKLEFPTYCLNLALGSLFEELEKRGLTTKIYDKRSGSKTPVSPN